MQIVAVVVTHSRPDLLSKVIEALRGQTHSLHRIVIVDNASGPTTQALLRRMTDVVVVRSNLNVGGAGGFAIGMKKARQLGADWVWLLDDDAIPRSDALAELANAVTGLPGPVGGVCGTVREFGDIAITHRRTFSPMLGFERPLARTAYSKKIVPIDTGSFVGFMVSSAAINAVGFPKAEFFLAYDDTEYSLRLKAAGFKLWLIPSSIVDHMREVESRLRHSEFGRKHYFNIRNRIAVKMSYSHFCKLSAFSGICFGCGLWIRCRGRFNRKAIHILARAISDGCTGRLGPYPKTLDRPK